MVGKIRVVFVHPQLKFNIPDSPDALCSFVRFDLCLHGSRKYCLKIRVCTFLECDCEYNQARMCGCNEDLGFQLLVSIHFIRILNVRECLENMKSWNTLL